MDAVVTALTSTKDVRFIYHFGSAYFLAVDRHRSLEINRRHAECKLSRTLAPTQRRLLLSLGGNDRIGRKRSDHTVFQSGNRLKSSGGNGTASDGGGLFIVILISVFSRFGFARVPLVSWQEKKRGRCRKPLE